MTTIDERGRRHWTTLPKYCTFNGKRYKFLIASGKKGRAQEWAEYSRAHGLPCRVVKGRLKRSGAHLKTYRASWAIYGVYRRGQYLGGGVYRKAN